MKFEYAFYPDETKMFKIRELSRVKTVIHRTGLYKTA